MCRYVVWLVGVELWWKSILSCGGGRMKDVREDKAELHMGLKVSCLVEEGGMKGLCMRARLKWSVNVTSLDHPNLNGRVYQQRHRTLHI